MVEGNENNQSEPDSGTGTPKRRGSLFGARRGRSRTPERDELSGAIPVEAPSAQSIDEIADALQFRIERELKEMGPIEGPGLAVDRSSLGLSPKKEGDD